MEAWETEKQRFLAVWDQQAVSEADPKLQNLQRLLAWGREECIHERVGLELSLNCEGAGKTL